MKPPWEEFNPRRIWSDHQNSCDGNPLTCTCATQYVYAADDSGKAPALFPEPFTLAVTSSEPEEVAEARRYLTDYEEHFTKPKHKPSVAALERKQDCEKIVERWDGQLATSQAPSKATSNAATDPTIADILRYYQGGI